MNKIVKDHIPVSELPKKWDVKLPDNARHVRVEIEVEQETPPRRVMSLDEILARRRPPYRTMDEIDEDIRRGREDAER